MAKLELIGFRGNKNLWFDFVNKIKKERKEVWDILKILIKQYLEKKNG